MQYIKFQNGTPCGRYESSRGDINTQRELHHGYEVYVADKLPLSKIISKYDGLSVPDGYKVDDAADGFVPLTEDEQLANGQLSVDDYNEQQRQRRRSEYAAIADPMFFDYQRGKVAKQDWLDECAKIKAKYKYK